MAHVLRSLDLSYNELDEIPFEALQLLTSLDWLNFHRYGLCYQIKDIFGPGRDEGIELLATFVKLKGS
jgi:hypothetical protein